MAIEVIDGFNLYDNSSQLLDGAWHSQIAGVIAVGGGRTIGNCLQLASGKQLALPKHSTGSETNYHRIGFSWKAGSITSTSRILVINRYSGGSSSFSYTELSFWVTTAGFIEFHGSNNALRWTSPAPVLQTGIWYYIEFGYRINNSGTLDMYVNGNLVHTMSTDTYYNSYDNYPVLCGNTGVFNYDDFYLATDTTMPPALGACTVETLFDNADTAQADFTGTVLSVDDPIGNHDGDTTYISSVTLGHKSEFDLENLSGTPTVVHALQMFTTASTDNAGSRGVTPYILSVAARSDDVEYYPNSGTYLTYISQVWEADPNTAVAWLPAGVNALKAGIEITT